MQFLNNIVHVKLKDFCTETLTLVYLVILQEGINVLAGNVSKINKPVGWNDAVQAGIFK